MNWGIIIGIVVILGVVAGGYFYFDPFGEKEITFEEAVCSEVRMTPSWVTRMNMVDEGYNNFDYRSSKDSVDLLINAGIYFVYTDNEVSNLQIRFFGDEWERYVNSGYIINCEEIK